MSRLTFLLPGYVEGNRWRDPADSVHGVGTVKEMLAVSRSWGWAACKTVLGSAVARAAMGTKGRLEGMANQLVPRVHWLEGQVWDMPVPTDAWIETSTGFCASFGHRVNSCRWCGGLRITVRTRGAAFKMAAGAYEFLPRGTPTCLGEKQQPALRH